ncbi:MAG: TolC family protein [Candidatus Schekmanbacteria bacterium]|nr:TolC family protein [Candidatus Schekmanbacteria bacterium]
MSSRRCLLALLWLPALLGGCAPGPRPDAAARDLSRLVAERAGIPVAPPAAMSEAEVRATLDDLLDQPLTAAAAMRIALLNNPEVRSIYEELGVSRAELLGAARLPNPVLAGSVRRHPDVEHNDLELELSIELLDVLFRPLRRGAAQAGFAAAQLRLGGAVLDLVHEVRLGFLAAQAAAETLALLRTSLAAAEASLDFAHRLHAAGNITDLDLANEQAFREEARLAVAAAELAERRGRERLNTLLGLWGPDTQWQLAPRLPEPPAAEPATEEIERQAVASSLDLEAARLQIEVAGRELGLARKTRWLPELEVGGLAEREAGDKEWAVGPSIELALPLFDQGQAAVAAAEAQRRLREEQYRALAIAVRAASRAARDRLAAARQRVDYYRAVVLPLRQRIVEQAQLQYNAMQLGAFELLAAKRDQIAAGRDYVAALHDYWQAHSDLEQVRNGRLPAGLAAGGQMPTDPGAAPAAEPSRGGH